MLQAATCKMVECIVDRKKLTRLLNMLAFCEYLGGASESGITPAGNMLANTYPCSISTFLGAVIFNSNQAQLLGELDQV